jgi:hypothetical protein
VYANELRHTTTHLRDDSRHHRRARATCEQIRPCIVVIAKKHGEIRIFVMAVTGSPRIFEKEFAHIDCYVLR